MKSCDRCKSNRVVALCSKSSDLNSIEYKGDWYDGYMPKIVNISSSDKYVEMKFCLECGKIQGEFPVGEPDI